MTTKTLRLQNFGSGLATVLLRLKELESLERLVEKVGRIDLHAGEGQGFDALLNKLVRFKPAETA